MKILAFIRGALLEISALLGVVLIGVGVGIHDVGAGLAAAGGLMVALAVFSSLLPRFLKDC